MPSARKKCICQLCTCGRHMCPHRNKDHIVLGDGPNGELLSADGLQEQVQQWEIADHGAQEVSAFVDKRTARQVLADATNRATAVTVDDKGNRQVAETSWSARQVPKRLPIRHPDSIKFDGSTNFTTLHQTSYTKKSPVFTAPYVDGNEGSIATESWNQRQIPKRLPIKNPDSLIFSGPISLETTNKSDFSRSVFENKSETAGDATHRPKTSLKLSGDFQSDSSYQRAFTPKHADEVVKVKKGVVKSHLKPEGKMTFDTTSLDYRAAIAQQAKWESESYGPLKSKASRPESEIKIPTEPLHDETTVLNDYRRWHVEKPERHKPLDTLELGYASPEADESSVMLSRKVDVSDQKLDEARWKASRTVSRRQDTNLKPEGDFSFETTNDVDYVLRRDRPRSSQAGLEIDDDKSINDYRRWNVEKPERHKPLDTLELGYASPAADESSAMLSRKIDASDQKLDEARWKASRTVSRRPDTNLKPEGDFSFETTNDVDYVLRRDRPRSSQTGLEIDDDKSINDYRRWNVEKPERHKPLDTLELGYASPAADESSAMLSRKIDASDQKLDEARWKASRTVSRRPDTNLKPEGDLSFETTNDVDYALRRDRPRPSQAGLEIVSEQTEASKAAAVDVGATAQTQTEANAQDESSGGAQTEMGAAEAGTADALPDVDTAVAQIEEYADAVTLPMDGGDDDPQNEVEYVSWDQIRPRPIRPHSNLRQEGGMEFNTTNRSEFVEKSSERVKGVRPKTTTKVAEGEFDATTMNQIMFAHDQGERVNPIRPKSNLHVEGGDFVDETTTAREYQQWQIKRPSPIRHKSSLTQEGQIDFTTTNNTEFEEKHPERVYPIRPSTTNKISGDLDLATTNQVMHGSFPIERVQKIVPQPNLRTSSEVFDGETTNKTQFQEFHVDRRKPIRPVPNLKQEGTMDFKTTNQMQFDEKPLEKVSQFRPQTSSKITGDFDDTTTNRVMYGAPAMEKPQAIRPKDNIELEKGEFSGGTMNQSEFQPWQPSKPQQVTPRNNLKQEGSMDFTTNNQLEFGAKVADRVTQIRPKTNSKVTGEFDSTTTNRIMYQDIPGEKARAVRPKTNMRVDSGNFEGETTNTRDFHSWEYDKPSLIKPHSSLRQEGSMDFTTMNNTQFEGKSGEKPASIRPITATKISGDFDGMTMNQAMFHNNPVERVIGKRPSTHIHVEGGKFEDETTARREFQKWELAKPDPIKHESNLTQEGSMDFTTSNQLEFSEKHVTKEEQIRPHTTSPVTGDFDGTTTNQVAYQGQAVDRVHDLKPKDNLRARSGEFQGETTTANEYGYKAGSKSEAVRPKGNISQEGDFDFLTSNQVEFEKKTVDRVTQTRPKTLTKTDGTFYSTTTNQSAFQTPAMETVHAVRPATNIHMEEGVVQGNTTSTDAYKQWKLERPKAFQLTSSLKQEGDMSFETTNHSEFREKSFERVQQIRPKTTSKIEGDFTATTTHQTMFHQPEKMERVRPIRHENNLMVEGGKFSNETTTNREYRQWVKQGNQIAVPKKKLVTAGLKTQRERANRRKEIVSSERVGDTQEKNKPETGTVPQELQVDPQLADAEIPDPGTGEAPEENMEPDHAEKGAQADKESWKLAETNEASVAEGKTRAAEDSTQRGTRARFRQPSVSSVVPIKRRYKPEDNLKIDHVPFDGTSTTRTEYQKWEGKRSSPKRRGENLKQEGQMKFDTTSNDYSMIGKYQIQRDANRTQAKTDLRGTLTQSGTMDFSTTSKSSYKSMAGRSRAKNLRPRSSLRLGVPESATNGDAAISSRSNPELATHEKEQLTSTSKASYVRFTGQRTRAYRPSTSQKVGGGAFEGQSTTRTSFGMPQDTPVTSRAVKPENHNILQTQNGFSGNTTYRSSFEKLNGHCPVLDLEAGKLPFKLAEERNGHLFYSPWAQG